MGDHDDEVQADDRSGDWRHADYGPRGFVVVLVGSVVALGVYGLVGAIAPDLVAGLAMGLTFLAFLAWALPRFGSR